MATKQDIARQTILWHWSHGTQDPKKLIEMTKIPKSTVYDIVKRIKEGKGIKRQPGSGRPLKLKAADRRRIVQMARNHTLWSSANIAAEAARKGSPVVSPRTVMRSLKKSGYRKWTPKKTTDLTDLHKKKRLAWCQKYRNINWRKVCITDESYFRRYRHMVKRWGKTRPTAPVPKFGPAIMAWGGISFRGTTTLCLTKGSIDANRYQEILQEHLASIKELYPDGFIFQQDGATAHTAKSTKKFLADEGIEVIDWPPNSPDLSPIENLWNIMKDALEKEIDRSPEHWMDIIQRIWDEEVPNHIEKLIDSMPDRILKCIAANGDKIKY